MTAAAKTAYHHHVMRNILVFLIAVSIFFCCGAKKLDAQENFIGFAVTPRAGFLWGRASEIVYNLPGELPYNDADHMSQLLWDFKPLIYLGIDLELGPVNLFSKNGFAGKISFRYLLLYPLF